MNICGLRCAARLEVLELAEYAIYVCVRVHVCMYIWVYLHIRFVCILRLFQCECMWTNVKVAEAVKLYLGIGIDCTRPYRHVLMFATVGKAPCRAQTHHHDTMTPQEVTSEYLSPYMRSRPSEVPASYSQVDRHGCDGVRGGVMAMISTMGWGSHQCICVSPQQRVCAFAVSKCLLSCTPLRWYVHK